MSLEDIVKTPDMAGVAGALIGALNSPGANWKEKASTFCAGIGAATFLSPYIAERVGLESPSGRMAFAFTVGLAGLNIISKLLVAVKRGEFGSLISTRKGKS